MKYYTKSAQYYKYFEDAKLIEIDNENKKLAIVLNGKEEIIDIFDAGPYIDYNPLENLIKDIKTQSYEENKDKSYGVLQIKEDPNYLDVNKIYKEIKNNKKNRNKNQENAQIRYKKIKFNLNLNSNGDSVEGENLIIYDREENIKNENQKSFPQMLSIFNENLKKNKKDKEEIINGKTSSKKYSNLSIYKFQVYFLSLNNSLKKIKLNIKKPKIKHKLLSVIALNNDTVLGIKWFCFDRVEDKEKSKNLSENEKYLEKSKLLLVVSQEGLIAIFKLAKYDPFCHIRVNTTVPGLQSQPFANFKEIYNLEASLKLFNPIIDFNLLDKPLEDINQTELRLITLHINNTFTFWVLVKNKNNVKLVIQYNFQLSEFVCENFLMDNQEDYLICFNKIGIEILLIKGQYFPYPVIYKYNYNGIIPSLKELQDLIYSNDVIEEGEDENEDEIDRNDISEENINEEEEEDEEEEREKNFKGKNANKNKYANKNKNKKYIKKDEIKNKKSKKSEKYKGKKNKENKEDLSSSNSHINSNDKEDDDFYVEDHPNFINKDENLFYEDDKYLKFIQKPCFLSSQNKFLFVNYDIKDKIYYLYCFDISQLNKVEESQDFLKICINEFDDNLITKLYSSKEKIYFSESPFYYFNPIKEISFDHNQFSSLEKRKILISEKQFDIETIIHNLYQGLFIREGNNIMIIKINILDEPDLDIITKDISLSKFIFYEQPTKENLKSNNLAKWTINNTLIINSVDNLLNIIKFTKEYNILGVALSKKKIFEIIKSYTK